LDRFAQLALALLAVVFVASCSGAVSGSPQVNDPTRITILPSAATLYSGQPTTFTISGGTGSYIVSSSNQAVVAVSGSVATGRVTVVPNSVTIDTPVTLTVRDTGTTPTASAALTVKPGTVVNEITITPSTTQGGSCAPAICSGGDAVVSATLSQGGVPLTGRPVRFDVVSGDFRFITSLPDASLETLETSITVVTDEAGRASARVRILAAAPNQTALLQVTDVTSGAFQRTAFVIAQATGTSPGFFATPQQLTFVGPREGVCADNVSADIFVFGGTPPYRISNASSAFTVSRDTLSFSGDSFTVTARGGCVAEPGLPIVVTDNTGRTVTVLVANVPGTTSGPPLLVAPNTVSLSTCTSVASVQAVGGTGTYFASSGSDTVIVTPAGNGMFTIQRNPNSPASPSPVSVAVSDGVTVVNVAVTLTGRGAGVCPAPPLGSSATSVTLTSCADVKDVTLSGGSGNYSVSSNNTRVSASVAGSVLSIFRTSPSGTFTPPATITVRDADDPGVTPRSINVNATGTGTDACT
jgi:hypothetical protein